MKGIACNRSLNEMLCRLNDLLKRQLYLHVDEACKLTRSRNNIVDIVSRLWTGQPRNRVRFHGGARGFSLFCKSSSGSGAHLPSYSVGNGALSSVTYRPELEGDHSLPSSAEGKTKRSHAPIPPYAFITCFV
jgi:hypothetical protein